MICSETPENIYPSTLNNGARMRNGNWRVAVKLTPFKVTRATWLWTSTTPAMRGSKSSSRRFEWARTNIDRVRVLLSGDSE
jgi:hypothetical protein